MADRHPLAPACARRYWLQPDGCEQAQRVVETAVEELLTAFAATLDPQRAWSPRFWRMGLGSFLWASLSQVFDHLVDAVDGTPGPLREAHVAFSGRDFVLRLPQDPALQAWLDACIASLDPRTAQLRAAGACAALRVERPTPGGKTPEALDGAAARLRRRVLFWEGTAEVVHFAAPFSHAEARRLAWRSRGRIRRLPCPERPSRLRYDGPGRATLAERLLDALGEASLLARVASGPLAALAPTAFVEQRDELAGWAARQPRPRVLASALGFERSPYFVALVDRAAAAGAHLVGIQHGGYYGQTDPTWSERLENQIADRYCTWGYRHQERQRPMPSIRLAQLRRPPAVGRPFARRALWAYSGTVIGATLLARAPHYREEDALSQALIAAVRAARANSDFTLALRPYPRLGRDFVADAWARELPEVAIEPARGRTLLEHSNSFDLTIFNFPGATGFLEFLQVDRPALIVSPPRYCPVRPAAQAAFDGLAAAGLYATDEASFAAAMRAWCEEGQRWWTAPQRVAARAAFAGEYARTSADVVGDWTGFLLAEADAAKASR